MLKKILNIFHSPVQLEDLDISFGRYSDAYKTFEKYDSWNRSLELFEKGNYIQSYLEFFNYLLDDAEANVEYELKEGTIEFKIYQGSKTITGYANTEEVVAQVRVAKINKMNIALGRKLMEMNYSLFYGCLSISPEEMICMRFSTRTADGFPGKLYHGLREIATTADQQDDILLDEFKNLEGIDDSHIRNLPTSEKHAKYNFIHISIGKTLKYVKQLNPTEFEGAITYSLLNLIYKIDFFTAPEGTLLSKLEEIQQIYLKQSPAQSQIEKNNDLYKRIEKLLEIPKEEMLKNFYATKSTFGIAQAIQYEDLSNFIQKHLYAAQIYIDKKHDDIVLVIFEYMASYALFNYGLPKPMREVLTLYLSITNPHYMRNLGLKGAYHLPKKQKLIKKLINAKINSIVKQNSTIYAKLSFDTQALTFKNILLFSKSYFDVLAKLDFRN
jgi:hypothetical protein